MPIVYPEVVINEEAVLEAARSDDPDDRERIMELAAEAKRRPGGAVYVERTVDSADDESVTVGGVTFYAKPLGRLFKEGMTVYPYVATCGRAMAEYGESLTDPLERFWWDTIMINAVGNARNTMYDEITRVAGYKPASANPGSIGLWPISNQPALFSLIGDVEGMIGVTVAPSFLMRPLKSVSGIFFRSEGDFTHNCCLCERENCEGRRAPFDAELKASLEN